MGESLQDIDHVRDLLDRLRLDRRARARGAVIVEGTTDVLGLADLLDALGAAPFVVKGRVNVLRAATRLESEYLPGVVCVADTDFDDTASQCANQWFLVFTDNADLEAMLFWTPALDRLLSTWASEPKLTQTGGPSSLRELIAAALAPLTNLRSENTLRGLGFNFKALDLDEMLDQSDLSLKMAKLRPKLTPKFLTEHDFEEIIARPALECPLSKAPKVHGGDALLAVDVALRKLIGSLSKQQVKGGFAERSLILAARATDLRDTPFGGRLLDALARARPAHGT